MKKWLVCLLVAMIVFSSVGCGGKGDTETKKVTEAKDLKIAMLLPSSPTDGGWGQIGATALNNAKNFLPKTKSRFPTWK